MVKHVGIPYLLKVYSRNFADLLENKFAVKEFQSKCNCKYIGYLFIELFLISANDV